MNATQPAAIAVVQHQDLWLVGRRPPGRPLAGLWEFPGGKLLAGESPAQAAVRECREETSLRVHVIKQLHQLHHDYTDTRVALWFFLCHPLDPDPQPSAPFRFVSSEQLATLDMPAANSQLLRCLLGRSPARQVE